VVYWGLASFYTPPMCIVVYVTIGISGSRVWETGWEAVRIGIAAFLIPFAFAINEGLMLRGGIEKIVLATTTAVIGAVLVAAGVRGYLLRPLNLGACILVLISGILFILPGYQLPLAGLAILAAMLMVQRFARAKLS